jgi:hypothetical protein
MDSRNNYLSLNLFFALIVCFDFSSELSIHFDDNNDSEDNDFDATNESKDFDFDDKKVVFL